VDGSTVSDNRAEWGGGISSENARTTVTSSRILNNTANFDGGGVAISAESLADVVSVTGSCIMGNSDASFFNDGDSMQTATGNWWGASSGPSGAGPGTGDSVSAYVDYGGFLTEPILGCEYRVYLPLVLQGY
jgi:hypothetical protein